MKIGYGSDKCVCDHTGWGQAGGEMTEQERQFDDMFKRWEEQFERWQEQNVDNPDQEYVNQHMSKMNEMRQKMLSRRESLRQQRPKPPAGTLTLKIRYFSEENLNEIQKRIKQLR